MRTSVIAWAPAGGLLFALSLGCSTHDAACAGANCDASPARQRPFRMGFTPFPFDTTAEAVAKVYEYLGADADLYAFHITAGVPWSAAAAKKKLPEWGRSVRATFEAHKAAAQAHPGHAVYLGLTPLDDSRSRLADEWDNGEHMPLSPPWDTYAFDAPAVKAAYLAFCEEAIAQYAPDYLAIGLEVNLLKNTNVAAWPAYVALHRETYQALKAKHPSLPIFVTVTAVDLLPGWTDSDPTAQAQALADVLPYSDYLALSFYPYMSKYLTGAFPKEAFDQIAAIAAGKPIAIAESGYPAETFTLTSIPATFEGTPDKQDGWLETLLAEADKRHYRFIVNFVARDYDALWGKLPPPSQEVALVWRDTGLWDGAGGEREALTRWRAALATPAAP